MSKMNFFSRFHIKTNPYQLAIFRILLGLHLIYACSSAIFELLLAVGETQSSKVLLPGFMLDFIAQDAVPFLKISTIVLSIFLILGFLTRIVMPLVTVTFLLLFAFYYKGVDAPIHWLYCWFVKLKGVIFDISLVICNGHMYMPDYLIAV